MLVDSSDAETPHHRLRSAACPNFWTETFLLEVVWADWERKKGRVAAGHGNN